MIQQYDGISRDSVIFATSRPKRTHNGQEYPGTDDPATIGNELARFLWLSLTQTELQCLVSSLSARLPVEGPVR